MEKVDRATVQTTGGASFETLYLKTELFQRVAHGGDGIARAPAFLGFLADVHQSAHEGPGGENHGLSVEAKTHVGFESDDGIVLDHQLGDVPLVKIEIGSRLDDVFDPELISLLIALGARGANARSFAAIEHAPLNGSGVRVLGHDSSKGIDLAHDMAFSQPTDRGIAAHLSNGIEILGEESDIAAHAGGSEGRFDPRVAGPDDDHVIRLSER